MLSLLQPLQSLWRARSAHSDTCQDGFGLIQGPCWFCWVFFLFVCLVLVVVGLVFGLFRCFCFIGKEIFMEIQQVFI